MRSSASALPRRSLPPPLSASPPATILSVGRVTHFRPNFRRHGPRLKQIIAFITITAGEPHLFFTTQEKERNLPASLSLPRPQRCTPLHPQRLTHRGQLYLSTSTRTTHCVQPNAATPRNSPRATLCTQLTADTPTRVRPRRLLTASPITASASPPATHRQVPPPAALCEYHAADSMRGLGTGTLLRATLRGRSDAHGSHGKITHASHRDCNT
ncbi:unnamed protein product [Ixodes pacificus]